MISRKFDLYQTTAIKKRQPSRKAQSIILSVSDDKSDNDHEIFSKRLMIIALKSAEDDDHRVLGQVSGKGWINRWPCLLT